MKKLFFLLLSVLVFNATMAQKKVVDYPYYEENSLDAKYCDISRLVLDGSETVLWLDVLASARGHYVINKDVSLVGNNTHKRYKLLSVDNAQPGDTVHLNDEERDCYQKITMHFEPLDVADLSFDYVENDTARNSRRIEGISTQAYDAEALRAWGKDAVSAFENRYTRGCIYVKGEACGFSLPGNHIFYPRLTYSHITGEEEEVRLNGEFFYTIPVYNTTTMRLFARDYHFIIAEPGDTVEINFDGKECRIVSNPKYAALQEEVSRYYNKNWDIYEKHRLMLRSVNVQGMYDCMQGMLCRRLLKLQKYIEKTPSLSPEAVYLLRSGIKSDVLEFLTSYTGYAVYNGEESIPAEYVSFIDELIAASTVPYTMNISPSYSSFRKYKQYTANKFYRYRKSERGGGGYVPRNCIMLLEKQRTGDITMSPEEVETVLKYPLSYTLRVTKKSAEDSVRYAKEIAECVAVADAYKRICEKYSIATPTDKEFEEAREKLSLARSRELLSSLPLPAEEVKFLSTVVLCRVLYGKAGTSIRYGEVHKKGEDAWSPSVLKVAMDGLEDFPLAPVIVEYNEKLRRPGSTEE